MKFYEIPEMEIVAFEVEDIITTSVVEEPQGNLNDIYGEENVEQGWSDFT